MIDSSRGKQIYLGLCASTADTMIGCDFFSDVICMHRLMLATVACGAVRPGCKLVTVMSDIACLPDRTHFRGLSHERVSNLTQNDSFTPTNLPRAWFRAIAPDEVGLWLNP